MIDLYIYLGTYSRKIFIHIQITESYHFESQAFQLPGPLRVLLLCIRMIVTAAIQFDDQRCFWTVKIYDISADRFLSIKAQGMIFQKQIP